MAEEVKVTETKNQETRNNEAKIYTTKKATPKVIFGVIALVAIFAILVGVYLGFRQKPVAGAKSITIEVVDNEKKSTVYDIHTDAEYLRQAMEEAEGLEFNGTESDYGLMVETVNGVKADFSVDGAYWCFYVNGGYCNNGIDTQPVLDGDAFQIKYEVSASE